MSDPERDEVHAKYEEFANMPLEEVKSRLAAIGQSLEEVRGHYTGPLGRFRKNIRDEDMEKLSGHMGDLLPMGLNRGVQEELVGFQGEDPTELAHVQIGRTLSDISMFLAQFPNSGVRVFEGQGFLD